MRKAHYRKTEKSGRMKFVKTNTEYRVVGNMQQFSRTFSKQFDKSFLAFIDINPHADERKPKFRSDNPEHS